MFKLAVTNYLDKNAHLVYTLRKKHPIILFRYQNGSLPHKYGQQPTA